MSRLEWHQAVDIMMKNVVKVSTLGNGYGSGVIVPSPKNTPGNCCVLTAYHVIHKAIETGATIEIIRKELPQAFIAVVNNIKNHPGIDFSIYNGILIKFPWNLDYKI